MKEIKILFLHLPEQSWTGTMAKPNGSLAYPYLGRALRDIGVESHVYDACVDNESCIPCNSVKYKNVRKGWQVNSNLSPK